MKGTVMTTTVAGRTYEVWGDFIKRGTMAKSEDGEIKQISWSGYVSNDLTVRKAIASAFQTGTFRK